LSIVIRGDGDAGYFWYNFYVSAANTLAVDITITQDSVISNTIAALTSLTEASITNEGLIISCPLRSAL
jgi:hypothetical protein